ncbi:MAG TPA: GGDEF domain-containing protein [Vicinamibacteria bacterium]|jgi:diguanylate cyclase (GGDEF)-like protein
MTEAGEGAVPEERPDRAFRLSPTQRYGLGALLLSLGAPIGLFTVRFLAGVADTPRADWSAQALTYVYVTVSTALVFTAFGALLGHKAEHLAQIASRDPLTALLTRRALTERLVHELYRARRYSRPLCALLVDVDRLKEVNDRGGHAAGDDALRRVAEAIRAALRTTDCAGRWGGDEFLVVAPETDAPAGVVLAERIRAGIDTPAPSALTVSVGVASTSAAMDDRALLEAADAALYRAKALGRNRVATGGGPPSPQP